MCSVSWHFKKENDLTIFFNRDERKSRSLGESPGIIDAGSRKILCPLDSKSGGTWFAVNDLGIAVGLLNQYRNVDNSPENPRSRGKLVLEIAKASGAAEVAEIIDKSLENGSYASFSLLVWHNGEVSRWNWANGEVSRVSNPKPLITSSSWDTDRVETWRQHFYDRKVGEEGWSRDQFHRHSIAGDEASSVCMMRKETQTVSLTRCRITDSQVDMSYFARDGEGHFDSGDTVSMPVNHLL